MEIAIRDGRYTASGTGGLDTVTGLAELAQRVTMKLAARRGGFAPLPSFGSRLYTLAGAVKPSERETAARQFVAEALADEQGLSISALTVTESEGTLGIALTLAAPGGTLDISITT
jgi:hypothetical protein